MPNDFKHVIFSGYLQDVPLMQDYLGLVNESRQHITITSFEYLQSQVDVPASLKAVNATSVPLEFDLGPSEGYYLLNLREPATFNTTTDPSEQIDDDIDDGDILHVEDISAEQQTLQVSDFDKEILGITPSTAKEKEKVAMSSARGGRGTKAKPRGTSSRSSNPRSSTATATAAGQPSPAAAAGQPSIATAGPSIATAGPSTAAAGPSTAVAEPSTTVAQTSSKKGKEKMRMPILSNLAKKADITSSLTTTAIITKHGEAVAKHGISDESTTPKTTSSSSNADYEGLLDLEDEDDQGLKRVRTSDTASVKKAKKKPRTELEEFIKLITERRKKK